MRLLNNGRHAHTSCHTRMSVPDQSSTTSDELSLSSSVRMYCQRLENCVGITLHSEYKRECAQRAYIFMLSRVMTFFSLYLMGVSIDFCLDSETSNWSTKL